MPRQQLTPREGSSLIKADSYDAAKHEYVAQFGNGDTWSYSGVTPQEYEQLHGADSRGSAFHSLIKGKKPAIKVG